MSIFYEKIRVNLIQIFLCNLSNKHRDKYVIKKTQQYKNKIKYYVITCTPKKYGVWSANEKNKFNYVIKNIFHVFPIYKMGKY